MKKEIKKIFVLDEFTNGHRAARVFMKQYSWLESEYEIVFCGNHANVLKQLQKRRAYAVVPVHNSIAGNIKEVTRKLAMMRNNGYILEEIGCLDLQVDHCLLAHQNVQRPEDLEGVMSHKQVIRQCRRFLDKIDIKHDKRKTSDSTTGKAIKIITKLGCECKIGIIASQEAAEAYNLKILAKNIQDVLNNKTTFLLLENKTLIKRVTE